MKRVLPALLLVFLILNGFKGDEGLTKENLREYIESVGIQHGDIVCNQAILESGYFQSSMFKETNNLFGMMAPYVRKTTAVGKYKGWAIYEDWRASVMDYKFWQESGKTPMGDYYYQYLQRRGYAKDPSYIVKLKSMN